MTQRRQNQPNKTPRSPVEVAQQLPVTNFLTYDEYLAALYKELKARLGSYSYLRFAEDLGFSATNVLRLVINRQRKLAPKSAATIATALELKSEDRRYFLALVAFNNARGASLRAKCFADLLAIKHETVSSVQDRRAIDYFSDWTRPVVRELLRLPAVAATPEAVRDALYPEIRVPKAGEVLDFLERQGFLVRGRQGDLLPRDDAPITLPSDQTAGHMSILSFHQEMLGIAKECLSKLPEEEREFNAVTLCLSQQSFDLIRKRLRDLCAEVVDLEAKSTTRDCVAQLNMQLFKLSKPRSSP